MEARASPRHVTLRLCPRLRYFRRLRSSTYPNARRPSFEHRRKTDPPTPSRQRAPTSFAVPSNTEILAHPIDRETKFVLVSGHGVGAIVHLPALCRALRNHIYYGINIKARLLGEVNPLAAPAIPQRCISDSPSLSAGLPQCHPSGRVFSRTVEVWASAFVVVQSPPVITVRAPFSAPACPPDTGASKSLLTALYMPRLISAPTPVMLSCDR